MRPDLRQLAPPQLLLLALLDIGPGVAVDSRGGPSDDPSFSVPSGHQIDHRGTV